MALMKMQEFRHVMGTTVACNDGGGGGISSSSDPNGYTIGVNIEVMDDLIDGFTNQTTGQILTIKNTLDSIYNKIDNGFVDCWTGAGYDEFKLSCDGYKESVYQIVTFMENYVKILENVKTESTKLTNSVSTSLDTTGSGGGR